MNKTRKQSKAREFLWLAFAFMSLVVAIHSTVYNSIKSSWYYFGFVLISLLLYMVRRNMRIKDNKE